MQLTGSRHSFDRRSSRLWAAMSETFWLLVIAVIALFAFFLALGAFGPGEVAGLTIGVAVLVVLWVVHAFSQRRHHDGHRDPAVTRNRERRGF